MDGTHGFFLSFGWGSVYLSNEWGLPWSVLLGEPCHLPFCQLLDPIRLLEFSLTIGDDKVWYPGIVIENESVRAVAGGERDCLMVGVQSPLEVVYLIGETKVAKGVLLLTLSNGGDEPLGNVEDSDWAVLVEFHHVFGSVEGDGS
jgi:hypothetical protein